MKVHPQQYPFPTSGTADRLTFGYGSLDACRCEIGCQANCFLTSFLHIFEGFHRLASLARIAVTPLDSRFSLSVLQPLSHCSVTFFGQILFVGIKSFCIFLYCRFVSKLPALSRLYNNLFWVNIVCLEVLSRFEILVLFVAFHTFRFLFLLNLVCGI